MFRTARRAAVLGMLVTIAVTSGPMAQAAGDVAVTVTYKGKGKVDATHEVWVFLFETPDLGDSARPIANQTVTKNGGTATFTKVAVEPVYIAVVYDEKGDYDGNLGPPPAGSPIGIYSTDGKTLAPVKPGAGAKVKLTFDDTRRR
jgi:uncharacterized protein (DUF2141 family)